jgi:hypothetical protein
VTLTSALPARSNLRGGTFSATDQKFCAERSC